MGVVGSRCELQLCGGSFVGPNKSGRNGESSIEKGLIKNTTSASLGYVFGLVFRVVAFRESRAVVRFAQDQSSGTPPNKDAIATAVIADSRQSLSLQA